VDQLLDPKRRKDAGEVEERACDGCRRDPIDLVALVRREGRVVEADPRTRKPVRDTVTSTSPRAGTGR